MRHTPGPWIVKESENEGVGLLIDKPLGYVICEMDRRETAKADACLIAMAPQLLEALIKVHQIEIDNKHYGDDSCSYCDLIRSGQ